MTTKPALYYAVVRKWWSSRNGWDVVKITSEGRTVAYGSYRLGTTRIALRDIKAKCDNEELANEALTAIARIYERHKSPIDDAQKALKAAERSRDDEIDTYVKSIGAA